MAEPIYLIVEQSPSGREWASIVWGPLTGRLAEKGRPAPLYMLRIDRLDEEAQAFWLSKGTAELVEVWRWLRAEGTLPPPNLADPPRPRAETRRELGPDSWWFPPGPPQVVEAADA
jgi:hypothetical protein